MVVLKYEHTLIKTGSDEISRKNDSAHLHHKEILYTKFGKNYTFIFRSSARTDIRRDVVRRPCHNGISLQELESTLD